jgi:CBS-domain-containing membrane protein
MEKAVIDAGGRRSLPRALLVFDEQYQLLGVVRRRDILKGLEPKFLRTMAMPQRKEMFEVEVDADLVDLTIGRIAEAMQSQADGPVSEVMQQIAATVDYEDHLAKVIYKMLARDLNLLPVMKENKVVGVVRSVDVFREVAGLIL